ncbi:MAG TPA: Crp/Fnr family transcriptional regulator [Pseudomonadota bacterium]|jgi:CRP-like cAMP-binding protein|nr:Crp/Fnr family transcriptional regulator [Pseudomonadota bacterium]
MASRSTGQRYQDPKKALWFLRKLPLFADIPHDTLQQCSNLVWLLELKRRQVVFLPGDPGGAVYFVSSGRIKISKVTSDGKELTLDYGAANDVFGELCLIDGGPREDMAEAMDTSVVIEFDRGHFERLVQKEGLIGFRLVKVLAQRRRQLEEKVENLIFKDVNSKLAELLLRLGQDFGVADKRGTLLSLKITHQEMANLIGSTRETVSLTLSQFRRSGLIATEGRRVILSDQEGLQALA